MVLYFTTILIINFCLLIIKAKNNINNNIGIFFYVHPTIKYTEISEVFSYTGNINTPNWINYPIELMKRSKKYLEPIGLKLGFNVMDWS
jgi:hypothetical protein